MTGSSARRSSISPGSAARDATAPRRRAPRSARRSSGTPRRTCPARAARRRHRRASSATRQSRRSGSRSSPSASSRSRASRSGPSRADTRVAWVEGRALPGGGRAWLPAELVLPRAGRARGRAADRLRDEQRARLRREPSTTRSSAALCELLERDAFMIVWANRLSLPLLDRAGQRRTALDAAVRANRPRVRRPSTSPPSTALPAVLGVVRAPDGVPGALGVGGGTAPTVERAWWKALAEAFAARAAGAKLALLDDGERRRAARGRVLRGSHPLLRRPRHARRDAAFLDASRERTPLESRAAARRRDAGRHGSTLCAGASRRAGSTAYAVDVTSPDVAELGLTVVTRGRARALRARRRPRRAVPRRPAALRGRRRARPARRAAAARTSSTPTRIRSRDRHARPPRSSRRSSTAPAASRSTIPPRSSTRRRASTRTSPPRGSTVLHELARRRRARTQRRALEPHARPPARRRAARAPSPLRGRLGDAPRAPAVEPRRGAPARSRCAELARVLGAAYAAARRRGASSPAGSVGGRALSARALRRSRSRSTGLEPGVYHYDPFRAPARAARAVELRAMRAALVDPSLADGAAAVARRHRACSGARGSSTALRGYRFALLEAGHVVQNAVLAAAGARAAGAAARRLLRPAARRARRRRRARRGERLRARCSEGRCDRGAQLWARVGVATALALALRSRSRRRGRRASGSRRRPRAARRRAPGSLLFLRGRAAAGRLAPAPVRLLLVGVQLVLGLCGGERGGGLAARRARRAPPRRRRSPRSPAARRLRPRRTARGRASISAPAAAFGGLYLATGALAATSPRTGPTTCSSLALVERAQPARGAAVIVAELDDVTKRFGARRAPSTACRFAVGAGEVVALLGPNGAGQVDGDLACCSGCGGPTRARRGSSAPTRAAPARAARVGVDAAGDRVPVDAAGARAGRRSSARHYERPARRSTLCSSASGSAGSLARQLGGLSGGERRRLAVALAFAGRPRLVVLDEPTAGLDREARRAVWDASGRTPTTAARSCSRPTTSRRPTRSPSGSS